MKEAQIRLRWTPDEGCHSRVYKHSRLTGLGRNETAEAPLYEIENIQHDNLIPFSGPGGRRLDSTCVCCG
jgi:hypothetical protein